MRSVTKKEWVLVLAVFAIGVFFRFYQLPAIPPGLYPDEATNGNNALEALATGDFKVFYPENNGREGLFINIQAFSVHLFGNTPWALRAVSALFGSLTVLGVWLLSRELFRDRAIRGKYKELWTVYAPLASAFFIATGFWHVNFSRIGFRAIMIPFLISFGLYWLLKGLRTGKISSMLAAGIMMGAGFHTYIAFRFVPFILIIPLGWYLWQWLKKNTSIANNCIPCSIAFFLFITFITALPIGWYFLNHPEDFLGRGGQVSIFEAERPLYEFLRSNALTLGMFNVHGDCNPRHNFACLPELFFPVGIFFLIGVASVLKGLFRKASEHRLPSLVLFFWFFFMLFPTTLTREGLPHALRAIGLLPAAYILAGLGCGIIWKQVAERIQQWLANPAYEAYRHQLHRIQKECAIVLLLILAATGLWGYKTYFIRFANAPATYFAFSADMTEMGGYLAALPRETKKYVIVNLGGTDIRGLPTPSQTVMFMTDTFRRDRQIKENMTYLLPDELSQINTRDATIAVIPLNPSDRTLTDAIKLRLPEFRPYVPGTFLVFTKGL